MNFDHSFSGGSKMKHDYGKAMSLSILFFDAQRSGYLPANNPIKWRGNSATNDAGDGHDLSGGWYDGTLSHILCSWRICMYK